MKAPPNSLQRLTVSLLAAVAMAANGESWAAAELVSVSTGGAQGFDFSNQAKTDATGRFVVFESFAQDFVSGDFEGHRDIFLRDRVAGTTMRVSHGLNGEEANANSTGASISADGRWIAFSSDASNLVPNDTNNARDIFVYDRLSAATIRASVGPSGAQSQGGTSFFAAISGNGRHVAFVSSATNLVANDQNGIEDVFVRDLQARVTTRVSLRSDGVEPATEALISTSPTLSHDGRHVAFASSSADLVPLDDNDASDIFIHDRQARTTVLVSRTAAGVLGNGASFAPALSADGMVVGFGSTAPNLVGAGGQTHVVVKDLRTGLAERPRPAATFSYGAALSADGTRVALTGKVGGADEQVEVIDRVSGEIFAPARLPNGGAAGSSFYPHLSADGRVVVFEADENGIAPEDQNFVRDVLARPLFDTIGFTMHAIHTQEDNGNVNVVVAREGVLNGAVSVQYAVSAANDTAVAGTDYNAAAKTGTLTWGAGDSDAKFLNFPLIDTAAADGYRFFTISLTSPTGGAVLGTKMTKVVIRDTETAPVEDRQGHGLRIQSIVSRGTNWDTGVFSATITVHNPAALPSFPGFVEIQFNGGFLENVSFDPIPAGGAVALRADADVGSFPDGDVYAILYETTPLNGAVVQDSGFAAGFVDNGTAPPSGGTTDPNAGLEAPGFPSVTVKSVVIEGDASLNEGTEKTYTAKVTLSDGTVLTNVTPAWKATLFTINGLGEYSAGEVTGNKSVTLSATVVRNGVATTGTRKITVLNIPAPPVITSPLTAYATTGKAFAYKIKAIHEPTSFAAAGLPAGLQVNTATGLISGSATADGTFPVQISATNALDTDTETLNLIVSDPSPLTVNITGSGTVTPDLNGQLLDVGRVYKLLAKPQAGSLFAGWSNGITSASPALKFTMVPNLTLDANFVPNPFLSRLGNYAGLIQSNPVTNEASGFFQAKIATTGACTGKLLLGGKSLRFKTILRPNGTSPEIVIPRSGAPPVVFSLALDVVTQSGALTGALDSGVITSTISANLALTDTSALAGYYTVILPGPDMPSAIGDIPDGSGFGAITLSRKGSIRVRGVLGDGTAISQSAPLTAGNRWPFYVPLYKGGGSVFSSVQFAANAQSDFSGEAMWFKAAQPKDAFYPEGWPAGLTTDLLGARYVPPPALPGLGAVDGDGNAMIVLNGGGLIGAVTQPLNVADNGAVTLVAPLQPRFSARVKAGIFSGAFIDPSTGASRKFQGAIQQKLELGEGVFRGALKRAGKARLQSNAP